MQVNSLTSRSFMGSRSFSLSGTQEPKDKKNLTLRELQEAKEEESKNSNGIAAQEGKRFVGGFRLEDGNTIVEISGAALSKLKNAQGASKSTTAQAAKGAATQAAATGAQTATARRSIGTQAANAGVGAQPTASGRTTGTQAVTAGIGTQAATGRRRIGTQADGIERASVQSATGVRSMRTQAVGERARTQASEDARSIGTQAANQGFGTREATGKRRIGTQASANGRRLGSTSRRGAQMQSIASKKPAVDIRSLGKQSVALQNQRNSGIGRASSNRGTPLMWLQSQGA